MGNKRPHPDSEPSGQHYEDPGRKRMRTNTRPHKRKVAQVDLDSLNAIKKRARAIERLLARDNLKLPSNKQRDLERELAAHKQRIQEARAKKERSAMIQKYHMVRFFERKKAMRFVKQLEKKVAAATDPETLSQLKADLHVAQVDVDYAIYFPFMESYVSLYAGAASAEKGDTDAAAHYLRTPRPPMWTVVEKTREEGQAALERLQNRRQQTSSGTEAAQQAEPGVPAEKLSSTTQAKKKGSRQERREIKQPGSRAGKADEQAGRASDKDDESDDGGFFE